MFKITSKLEINVLNPDTNYRLVSDFAVKHRCHAVVLASEFVPMALSDRSAKNGQFNIATAIDFPFGKNFALDKFKNIDPTALSADCMDILLTPGRTPIETENELMSMTNFIKGAVNPLVDIRYTVGCHSGKWDDVKQFLMAARKFPCEIVRMDQNLRSPQVDIETQLDMMRKLKELTPKAIKVSGNVNLNIIEEILEIDERTRFDVDIDQAMHIAAQIKDKESKAREPKSRETQPQSD